MKRSKRLKESTKNSPFVSPFLGKRGGTKQKRFFKGASRYQSNNNNDNNNNRNHGYNNYNQKKNQNKGFKQKEIQFSKQEVNVRISNTLPFKLLNTTENFVAGKTKIFEENWHKLTTDPWIRNTITGYQVEMNDQPVQINET